MKILFNNIILKAKLSEALDALSDLDKDKDKDEDEDRDEDKYEPEMLEPPTDD